MICIFLRTDLSGAFEQKLLRAYQELDALGLAPDAVTTTSLYVADVLKRFVPGAERRASINMRLGTYWQMEKLFDLFDGFYLMREYNYNLLHIAKLRRDLDAVGKKLYLLANSGCMSYCPGQTFHDNLVAHEDEVGQAGNPSGFVPYVCWRHYQKKENHADLLKNTWIRPEDLWRYEGLFSCVKLATRKHQRPMRVISAYAHGKYNGNPLELTEPSHSALLLPGTLSNRDFPPDWFDQKAACNRQCAQCNYCESVWHMVYKDRSAQDL